MLILGTYPADFNMIEYAQRVRHYLPELKEKGVQKFIMVVNGEAAAANKLASLLELPEEVELVTDPAGEAGRKFGASRGWRPDDAGLNPYLKLYLMLFGLGPPNTLPAVITGYIGNPSGRRAWIESALEQGQKAGRWPDTVLDLNGPGGKPQNKFDDLPLVGGWGRRPLELATLRLQNLKMAFDHWSELKPTDERCLTRTRRPRTTSFPAHRRLATLPGRADMRHGSSVLHPTYLHPTCTHLTPVRQSSAGAAWWGREASRSTHGLTTASATWPTLTTW